MHLPEGHLCCVCAVLQSRLADQSLVIPEPRLIAFLKFCSENYDRAGYKGKLPAVLYVEDAKAFVICT